jgi:hypothetical protein
MKLVQIAIELDKHGRKGPMYITTLPDGTRMRPSKTPFCHAARELLRLNLAASDDRLELHREGIMCLVSTIGNAAALTVLEPEKMPPYFAPYAPWDDPLEGL